jgi:uncharacterized membrane protein
LVWIITALAAAIISSIGNVFDSFLVSKKMPSLTSFLIPMGVSQIAVACVLLAIFPFPNTADAKHILVTIGASVINSGSFLILLNSLRKGEVSRAIPVISTAPIFVALLAIPLLGATLTYWQWLAVIMSVAGAVLISLQFGHRGGKTKLQKSFFLLLLAALMGAVGSIGFKYGLEQISFWNVFGISGLCIGTIVLAYALRKTNLEELKNLPQRTQKISLVVIDQLVGITSAIIAFKAMGLGPVSLVNAILNIRPVFVFIFSLVLSRFLPNIVNEPLQKRTALIKFTAIAIMTAGIVIISLSTVK